MKPNYKKIYKVNLPKQYFLCSGERSKEKDQYCVYFQDIENQEMILKAIKNMEGHYIQIISDTKDELYQSTVKILKASDKAEKKAKMNIDGHTKLLCRRHKVRIDGGVVEYLQSHNDEWIDVLFDNFVSKGKIIELSPQYKNKAILLSSRLTLFCRKLKHKKEAKVRLSPTVYMYNLNMLENYGII